MTNETRDNQAPEWVLLDAAGTVLDLAAAVNWRDAAARGQDWLYLHNLPSFAVAESVARQISERTGREYIAADNGQYTSHRYSVGAVPRVGDPVSKGFNGDYYPVGFVASVSASRKVITTTTGYRFYRHRRTAAWRLHQCWWLIAGHRDERNPSF